MSAFTRLFRGRINRQTYLFGITVNIFITLFLDIPMLMDILVRFPRPFHVDPRVYSMILPIALLLIVLIQLFYFFAMDVRRGHDLGARSVSPAGQNILFWHYYTKEGENKDNKYGKKPKQKIDIIALFAGISE